VEDERSGMEQAAELLKEAENFCEQAIKLIQKAYDTALLDTTKIDNKEFLGRKAINYKGLAIRNLVLLLEILNSDDVLSKINSAKNHLLNTKTMTDSVQATEKRAKEYDKDKDYAVVYRGSRSTPIDSY